MKFQDQNITPKELQRLMQKGEKIHFIDVREPHEFDFCKIEGSFNFPLITLLQNCSQMNQEEPIVTICHHGVRSLKAAIFLKDQGFHNVASLKGGVDAWAETIDLQMKRY